MTNRTTDDPLRIRTVPLGSGGPLVSEVCVGTSPLGGMPHIYGYDVAPEAAIATVVRALESGINFLDTSNNYGNGESERRIGQAIRIVGGLPDGFVIATKADPASGVNDFSGERVIQSFEESIGRLGLNRIPVFYLHDPEQFDFDYVTRRGGAVDAMKELKSRGCVDQIGVAGGDLAEMRRYVDTGAFDLLLNHNQFTLLDQTADGLISHAVEAGLRFVNAAPYASGMLAKAQADKPRYQYREPSDAIARRAARLAEVCATHGVSLAAAALQFSTRDPRISSTVVGVSSPERVDDLIRNASAVIPPGLWDDLEVGRV